VNWDFDVMRHLEAMLEGNQDLCADFLAFPERMSQRKIGVIADVWDGVASKSFPLVLAAIERGEYPLMLQYYMEKIPQQEKKMVLVGHVTRALNAALVLVDRTTREDHFLCERVAMPACSHVAQSSSAQVLWVAHTNRATCIAGCAQCLGTGDQGRSK